MQEGANEILKLANKALPGAWEAMLRQVYIYGALFMIATMVFGITTTVLLFKLRAMSEEEYNKTGSHGEIMLVSMFVSGFLSIVFLVLGVLYLINPEYHAIQLLKI